MTTFYDKPDTINQPWADTGTTKTPTTADIAKGWYVTIPPYQTQNWWQKRVDYYLAHNNQYGVSEWDSTTYYVADMSYTLGSDGNIYRCLVSNSSKDPTNTANATYWGIAFDDYGEAATVQTALTTHITNYGTLASLTNTSTARTNLSVYSKAETSAAFANIAGNSALTFSVATPTSDYHAVNKAYVTSVVVSSTNTTAGIVRLATASEVNAGTSTTTAVTPYDLNTYFPKRSNNLSDLSSVSTARSNLSVYSKAETDAAYTTKANNLSDVASVSTARTNLGLGSMALEAAADYPKKANNLSDLASASTARTNLGLGDVATTSASLYAKVANNLSDLPSASIARTNLGLGSIATAASTDYLKKTNNLSDLASASTARTNLGLGDVATTSASLYAKVANNLSDLPSASTARTNLGLSDVAYNTTISNYLNKPGEVSFFAMTTAPSGWLKADGSALLRTTYSALFSAIGTTFGAGDGSTTFNLPNLCGQFLRGYDDGQGVDSGRIFGSNQSCQVQTHKHVVAWGEVSTGPFGNTSSKSKKGSADTDSDNYWYYTNDGSDYDTTVNSAGVVGSETRPTNVALLVCIKY